MAAEESAGQQQKTGGSQGTRGAVSFGSAGAGEVQCVLSSDSCRAYQRSFVRGVQVDERQYRETERKEDEVAIARAVRGWADDDASRANRTGTAFISYSAIQVCPIDIEEEFAQAPNVERGPGERPCLSGIELRCRFHIKRISFGPSLCTEANGRDTPDFKLCRHTRQSSRVLFGKAKAARERT
jgi:hypothetical protein